MGSRVGSKTSGLLEAGVEASRGMELSVIEEYVEVRGGCRPPGDAVRRQMEL